MAQIETYVPFYRKYRPQDFASIVGQKAIVQTLANAIETNKVAHAYLFCGPRGTGKTSMARIFAKSLNCASGPTVTPCQTCELCQGVTQGNALDVTEFDAASNNGVEDARELIENIQFAPMAGRYKIYIIDEVHMLSNQAFNTLLKTLEEPPPNVIFIFATTEAHKVLPTIISRCQRFDFTRITVSEIIERLQDIATTENIQIDTDALTAIARHARGGMRDAQGLLDQVSVLSRAQPGHVIDRSDVTRFIGSLEEDVLVNLAQAIGEKDTSTVLQSITALIHRGIEPGQLIKDLTLHFRNLFLVKASEKGMTNKTLNNPAEMLDLPTDYFEKLQLQAQQFEAEELPQMLEALGRTERNIRTTQQSQLWLEIGLLDLAYRQDIHLIQDLSDRVEALETKLAGQPVGPATTPKTVSTGPSISQPVSRPEPTPTSRPAMTEPPTITSAPTSAPVNPPPAMSPPSTPAPAPPMPNPSGDRLPEWDTIVHMVANPSYKSLLREHSFLIEMKGNSLTIGCSSEPTLKLIKRETKLIHLQKAVDQYFGHPMQLNLILEKKPEKNSSPKPVPIMAPSSSATPSATLPPASPEINPPELPSEQPALEESEHFVPAGNEASPTSSETDVNEARKYTVELLQGKIID